MRCGRQQTLPLVTQQLLMRNHPGWKRPATRTAFLRLHPPEPAPFPDSQRGLVDDLCELVSCVPSRSLALDQHDQ